MIIKKLVLENKNDSKKIAKIEFEDGINIVSGVSDTGKSYIFQCINYLLGGSQLPKNIPEAKDYLSMFLEISINNNIFTIKRVKDSDKVELYPYSYESICGDSKKEILNLKKTVSNKKENMNLSDWLLAHLVGEDSRKIKILNKSSNKQVSTRNISFRDVFHFCVSSEQDIIGTCSPFFTSEHIYKTAYKAIFKYLISGDDDSKIENINYEQEQQNQKNRLQFLEDQIDNVSNKINFIINNTSDIKNLDLLENLNSIINLYSQDLEELNKKIFENNNYLNNNKFELIQLISQKSSFTMLLQNYENQLIEINHNNNFADILQKIPVSPCPLCKQQINFDLIDEHNLNKLHRYYQQKYNHIKHLKDELQKTIHEVEIKIIESQQKVYEIEECLSQDQNKVSEIKELLLDKNEKLHNLRNLQLDVLKIEVYKEQLEDLIFERDNLKKKKKHDKKKNDIIINNINSYCNSLQNLINKWTGIDNKIEFDNSNYDIIINRKGRDSYGKGFRAFYSTAMIIALQRFLFNSNRLYPGFTIIDSPLVSLKEQKHSQKGKNEEFIDNFMQTNMIEDLIENQNLGQIIIFENKEFKEYQDKINYIYFSEKNTDGFIPM